MNQLQTVLDALENTPLDYHSDSQCEMHIEAIAIVKQMMQAEPVLEVVRMPDHWDGRYFRDDGGSYISERAISKLPIGTLLYAAPQAVPEGFVLVPVKPTQSMCIAGQYKAREWPKFPLRIAPIYQAMLAAAEIGKGMK